MDRGGGRSMELGKGVVVCYFGALHENIVNNYDEKQWVLVIFRGNDY